MQHAEETHSPLIGYILWIFGFLGSHRFYYGRKISGTIYFLTFGLFFIGWFIDLFLIPGMSKEASNTYQAGPVDYDIAWILLTFLGIFGIHRFYQGKWISGILYLLTGGFFMVGIIYDFWNLNEQVSLVNTEQQYGEQ